MKTYTAQELEVIIEKHGKWLHDENNGSRADLSGADLSRANLSGANLSRADLSGANLSWANLSRADLSGAKGLIYISQRSDGHQFLATYRNGQWMIQAGCRLFSPAEYRAHTESYSCDKKRAETLLLIDFAEAMIAQRGIV